MKGLDLTATWRWAVATLAAMLLAYPILVSMSHESIQLSGFCAFTVIITLFNGYTAGLIASAWRDGRIKLVQIWQMALLSAAALTFAGFAFNTVSGWSGAGLIFAFGLSPSLYYFFKRQS